MDYTLLYYEGMQQSKLLANKTRYNSFAAALGGTHLNFFFSADKQSSYLEV